MTVRAWTKPPSRRRWAPGASIPWISEVKGTSGDFGLGLKTASFWQYRRLTVASRRSKSSIAVRRWDLDHVARTREWQLLKREAEGSMARLRPLQEQRHGTLVLWERLDRVVGDDAASEDSRAQDAFLALVDGTVRAGPRDGVPPVPRRSGSEPSDLCQRPRRAVST